MIRVVSEKYKSIEKFALDYLSLAGFVPEIEKEYIIFNDDGRTGSLHADQLWRQGIGRSFQRC